MSHVYLEFIKEYKQVLPEANHEQLQQAWRESRSMESPGRIEKIMNADTNSIIQSVNVSDHRGPLIVGEQGFLHHSPLGTDQIIAFDDARNLENQLMYKETISSNSDQIGGQTKLYMPSNNFNFDDQNPIIIPWKDLVKHNIPGDVFTFPIEEDGFYEEIHQTIDAFLSNKCTDIVLEYLIRFYPERMIPLELVKEFLIWFLDVDEEPSMKSAPSNFEDVIKQSSNSCDRNEPISAGLDTIDANEGNQWNEFQKMGNDDQATLEPLLPPTTLLQQKYEAPRVSVYWKTAITQNIADFDFDYVFENETVMDERIQSFLASPEFNISHQAVSSLMVPLDLIDRLVEWALHLRKLKNDSLKGDMSILVEILKEHRPDFIWPNNENYTDHFNKFFYDYLQKKCTEEEQTRLHLAGDQMIPNRLVDNFLEFFDNAQSVLNVICDDFFDLNEEIEKMDNISESDNCPASFTNDEQDSESNSDLSCYRDFLDGQYWDYVNPHLKTPDAPPTKTPDKNQIHSNNNNTPTSCKADEDGFIDLLSAVKIHLPGLTVNMHSASQSFERIQTRSRAFLEMECETRELEIAKKRARRNTYIPKRLETRLIDWFEASYAFDFFVDVPVPEDGIDFISKQEEVKDDHFPGTRPLSWEELVSQKFPYFNIPSSDDLHLFPLITRGIHHFLLANCLDSELRDLAYFLPFHICIPETLHGLFLEWFGKEIEKKFRSLPNQNIDVVELGRKPLYWKKILTMHLPFFVFPSPYNSGEYHNPTLYSKIIIVVHKFLTDHSIGPVIPAGLQKKFVNWFQTSTHQGFTNDQDLPEFFNRYESGRKALKRKGTPLNNSTSQSRKRSGDALEKTAGKKISVVMSTISDHSTISDRPTGQKSFPVSLAKPIETERPIYGQKKFPLPTLPLPTLSPLPHNHRVPGSSFSNVVELKSNETDLRNLVEEPHTDPPAKAFAGKYFLDFKWIIKKSMKAYWAKNESTFLKSSFTSPLCEEIKKNIHTPYCNSKELESLANGRSTGGLIPKRLERLFLAWFKEASENGFKSVEFFNWKNEFQRNGLNNIDDSILEAITQWLEFSCNVDQFDHILENSGIFLAPIELKKDLNQFCMDVIKLNLNPLRWPISLHIENIENQNIDESRSVQNENLSMEEPLPWLDLIEKWWPGYIDETKQSGNYSAIKGDLEFFIQKNVTDDEWDCFQSFDLPLVPLHLEEQFLLYAIEVFPLTEAKDEDQSLSEPFSSQPLKRSSSEEFLDILFDFDNHLYSSSHKENEGLNPNVEDDYFSFQDENLLKNTNTKIECVIVSDKNAMIGLGISNSEKQEHNLVTDSGNDTIDEPLLTVVEEITDRADYESNNDTTDKCTSSMVEDIPNQADYEISDDTMDKCPSSMVEEIPDQADYESSNDTTDNHPSSIVEKIPDKADDESSDDTIDKCPSSTVEDIPDQDDEVYYEISNDSIDNYPSSMTEDIPDQADEVYYEISNDTIENRLLSTVEEIPDEVYYEISNDTIENRLLSTVEEFPDIFDEVYYEISNDTMDNHPSTMVEEIPDIVDEVHHESSNGAKEIDNLHVTRALDDDIEVIFLETEVKDINNEVLEGNAVSSRSMNDRYPLAREKMDEDAEQENVFIISEKRIQYDSSDISLDISSSILADPVSNVSSPSGNLSKISNGHHSFDLTSVSDGPDDSFYEEVGSEQNQANPNKDAYLFSPSQDKFYSTTNQHCFKVKSEKSKVEKMDNIMKHSSDSDSDCMIIDIHHVSSNHIELIDLTSDFDDNDQ